ncbi:NeuD/PglB/VioB family sugar acetyltransferase [Lacisediminihabitans sp.]|uniref:NeuD/PglB/VioB family sugar acetyltransferase n=1 Tax=Lacisediminihabitans sp. TaxID=2787631 RepID=UPI00374DDC45
MEDIVLVGASGLAREVIALLAESTSQRVVGVIDDNASALGSGFGGVPVLGTIEDAIVPGTRALLCVGAGSARERIAGRLASKDILQAEYATVLDPSVRNPGRCPIGPGSILLANVTLTADLTVGAHVVIMPGATITHDDVIEDFATLAAGVSLGGGVRIGRGAYLGMNSSVRPGSTVGAYSTLGMGAALLSDLPDHQTWVGVPARPIAGRDHVGPQLVLNREGGIA